MGYTIERQIEGDIDDIDAAVRDALGDAGFGVLTEIDVAATLEEKLGIEDHHAYRILGACDPELAHQAIEAEPSIGALLPCNVVLTTPEDASQNTVLVRAVDPVALLSVADNSELDTFASDVRDRLEDVLDAVAA